MKNKITEIYINDMSSIKSNLYLDKDKKLLLGRFIGDYKKGSKGNLDGLFIFSKIASIYFLYDLISVLVFDLRELNYSWGNTLLKSLNFFNEIGRDKEEKEKKIVVVLSQQNKDSIKDLLKNSNCIIFEDYDKAYDFAEKEAIRYLTD